MKIVERKFKIWSRRWDQGILVRDWEMVLNHSEFEFILCGLGFNAMFDVPEEIKMIWLSLHNRPASNRAAVNVVCPMDGFPTMVIVEHSSVLDFSHSALDRLLKPLVGKTVHLQCEYEI